MRPIILIAAGVLGSSLAHAETIDIATTATQFYERSRTEGSERRYPEAIEDLQKAVEMEPRRFFAWTFGQEPKLVEALDQMIAQKPVDSFLYRCRGNAREDRRAALTDYSKAIELAPGVWNNFNARGQAYLTLDEYDNAVVDLTKAIELNASLGSAFLRHALLWRAYAYKRANNFALSIADLSQALALQPNDISVLMDRARAYVVRHDWQKAIDDFSAVISFEPRGEYYLERAYVYQQHGDDAASRADYARAFELDPALKHP